ADTVPARSGGAEPMMVSVVNVAAADPPRAHRVQPSATTTAACAPPTRACTANPTAATDSSPARATGKPSRCDKTGLNIGPAIASAEAGSESSPACKGDRPRTSCKYWLTSTNEPNDTNTFSTFVANATLNAE